MFPRDSLKATLAFCLGLFRILKVQDCPTGLTESDLLWKSLGQPGKTVPREFPRAAPSGTPEGQFFQAAPLALGLVFLEMVQSNLCVVVAKY